MHLVQCMNASSTVTTSTSSGARPATANRSRSHPLHAMRAVPLTLSDFPFSRNKKDQAENSGLLQHVAKRISAQVAGALGDRDRPRVARARSPPDRPLERHRHASVMQATMTNGDRAMNARHMSVQGLHDLSEHAWAGLPRTPPATSFVVMSSDIAG